MAFLLSFLIQPCKIAMKIQQPRHKTYLSGSSQRDENTLLAHHEFPSEGVLCSILWCHKHRVFIGTFQTNSISNDKFAK